MNVRRDDAKSATMTPDMLSLQHLTASRGTRVVLRDVSFDAKPGDVLCITGEEGSGKTSLLMAITRVINADEGVIKIDGAVLAQLPNEVLRMYRTRVGYLDERGLLDETLTLERNIALPLDLAGVSAAERDRAVSDLVKRLRLGTAADRLPRDVSRGERQLAAFARAIITGPAVILLDEPFQGLSDETANIAATLLENMSKKGATIIVTSAEERTATFFDSPRLARIHRGRVTEASIPATSGPTRARDAAHIAMEELVERTTESETAPVIQAPEKPQKTGEKKKIRITSVGSL